LLAYPVRMLEVEATCPELEMGQWRSKVAPERAIGSLLGWQAMGSCIHVAGDHEPAGRRVARLLYGGGRYCSRSRDPKPTLARTHAGCSSCQRGSGTYKVPQRSNHAIDARATRPLGRLRAYPFRPSSNGIATADRSMTTRTTAFRIQPSTVRRRAA